MVWRGGRARPVLLLAFVFLPWLPVPPALQLWAGGLVLLVWIAFVAAMSVSLPVHLTHFAQPGVRTAGALAFIIALVAW